MFFLFSLREQAEVRQFLSPLGVPKARYQGMQILHYSAFECGYLPRVKLSLWVAYCYKRNENAKLGRYQGRFVPDTFQLKRKAAAFPAVYDSVPGFIRFAIDKGHLAPDAAIKIFGRKAQRETYFLTNIIPQFGNTNRFIWAGLEKQIRSWGERDTVWVVTGPVFYPQRETCWLGTHNVPIPHACYCTVLRRRPLKMIGFIVPNDSIRRYARELPKFIVSVDSIEKLTGVDFWPDLPAATERELEAKRAPDLWH